MNKNAINSTTLHLLLPTSVIVSMTLLLLALSVPAFFASVTGLVIGVVVYNSSINRILLYTCISLSAVLIVVSALVIGFVPNQAPEILSEQASSETVSMTESKTWGSTQGVGEWFVAAGKPGVIKSAEGVEHSAILVTVKNSYQTKQKLRDVVNFVTVCGDQAISRYVDNQTFRQFPAELKSGESTTFYIGFHKQDNMNNCFLSVQADGEEVRFSE